MATFILTEHKCGQRLKIYITKSWVSRQLREVGDNSVSEAEAKEIDKQEYEAGEIQDGQKMAKAMDLAFVDTRNGTVFECPKCKELMGIDAMIRPRLGLGG